MPSSVTAVRVVANASTTSPLSSAVPISFASPPLPGDTSFSSINATGTGAAAGATPRQTPRIIGSDGEHYTLGQAVRLGLVLRTACKTCRDRKVKCDGRDVQQGGCLRCEKADKRCLYGEEKTDLDHFTRCLTESSLLNAETRNPIGRPRKRKADSNGVHDEDASSHAASPSASIAASASSPQLERNIVKLEHRRYGSTGGNVTQAAINGLSHLDPRLFSSSAASSPASSVDTDLATHSNMDGIGCVGIGLGMGIPSSSIGGLAIRHAPPVSAAGNAFQSYHSHEWSTSDSPSTTNTSASHGASTPMTGHVSPAASAGPGSRSASGGLNAVNAHIQGGSTRPEPSLILNDSKLPLNAQQDSSHNPSQQQLQQQPSPSLDDLSIAAFLQSLDTLEINPSDGLDPSMLLGAVAFPPAAAASGPMSNGTVAGAGGEGPLFPAIQTTSNSSSMTAPFFDGSAILDPNISYAVPADFSWWDLSQLGIGMEPSGSSGGSSAGSAPALATAVAGSVSSVTSSSHHAGARHDLAPSPSDQPRQLAIEAHTPTDTLSPHSATIALTGATATTATSSCCTTAPPRSPIWPRGRQGGMGKGSLTTAEGVTIEALDWGEDEADAMFPDFATSPQDQERKSCCAAKDEALMPQEVKQIKDVAPAVDEAGKEPKACCGGKSSASEGPPLARPPDSPRSLLPSSPALGHPHSPSTSSSRQPPGTGATVKRKVFCVPNPSGKGCTCLCDMSVALISVRKTLREAVGVSATSIVNGSDSNEGADAATKKRRTNPSTTLQLTLSASQAVAAHCACSAECPTCRTDPSAQLSASLLVSTALQIYARAIKTLKEGVGSALGVGGGSGASKVDLDVKIGDWRPSQSNARKIALFAMKLELRDLRKALGKVSDMAKRHSYQPPGIAAGGSDASAIAGASNTTGIKGHLLNPIDQIVIDKLHSQLGEILQTVETLQQSE